jgi:hypothetical protein
MLFSYTFKNTLKSLLKQVMVLMEINKTVSVPCEKYAQLFKLKERTQRHVEYSKSVTLMVVLQDCAW